MRLKPCVRCGSKDIKIRDCGYSSFNVGYATCQACDYEVQIGCGCFPDKEIAKAWNKEKKRLETKVATLLEEAADIKELLAGRKG